MHRAVQHARQDGEIQKGPDQHQPLLIRLQTVEREIQKRDHQEKPQVHQQIPGVLDALEADELTDHPVQAQRLMQEESAGKPGKGAAHEIGDINAHKAQIIPRRELFLGTEIPG